MTLRWRLTFLTAALIAVASALLGVATYFTSSRIQMDSVDISLLDSVNRRVQPPPRGSVIPVEDGTTNPIAVGRLNRDGSTISVLKPAGTAVDPLPFPDLTQDQVQQARLGPITVQGSPAYRVLIGQTVPNRMTVVAASPLSEIESNLNRLALGTLLAALLVTLLAAAAAWLIVRRSFRPVNKIIESAQAIANGDLDRRVAYARVGTEIGDMSQALNAMIGSLTMSLTESAQSEERLRTFVSDASHEIRTPLTVIRGYVELLKRQPSIDDEQETRALARIDSESKRLERLVTHLLLLERLDTTSSAGYRAFDLAPLVREHCADIALLQGERTIILDLDEVRITGDPDAWSQLIANLAQNIMRYTPEDSGVHVILQEVGSKAVLTVDDSGPGIPADQRAAALDRFTRLDPSRSTQSGGFGLGMSIISSVVQGHGGTIELLESPAGGLRVRVSIPTTSS